VSVQSTISLRSAKGKCHPAYEPIELTNGREHQRTLLSVHGQVVSDAIALASSPTASADSTLSGTGATLSSYPWKTEDGAPCARG
jgi:hypothetical protein